MIREVVKIDESKCDGCGLCVPNCHEGALQIIDGKARLISDLLCDGLGACIGHCPQGAITIEKREAEPYNEIRAMDLMIEKGVNTVVAHLKHLIEHNETEYFKEGLDYLHANKDKLQFDINEVLDKIYENVENEDEPIACGCPGSMARDFSHKTNTNIAASVSANEQIASELTQWPIQLHLINPSASYFKNTDLLVSADCVAFSLGNFHPKYLKGKKLIIACPKLDDDIQSYIEKIRQLIDIAQVNTITVMIMQVPCCRGLLQIVQTASENAKRKVPVKLIVVGLEGEILQEIWV
jgi:ferredoxin